MAANKRMRSFKSYQEEYYTSKDFNPLKETGEAYRSTTRYLIDKMNAAGKDTTLITDIISLKREIDRFFKDVNTNGVAAMASWFFDGFTLKSLPPETTLQDAAHTMLTSEEETHGAFTFYYFENGVPVVNTIITPVSRTYLYQVQEAALTAA